MIEPTTLRHLTEAKAYKLVHECGYQASGHILYSPDRNEFAFVVYGRVRYVSPDKLQAFMSAPDVIEKKPHDV